VGRCVSSHFASVNNSETGFACSRVSQNLSEDQCIFIRGFRVARTLGIFPKHLKAAAETPEADEFDEAPGLGLVSTPAVTKVRHSI
jgi:hypothetical protein